MSDPSQIEADRLLSLEKKRCHSIVYNLPDLGGRLNVELESLDGRELFMLDIGRGRIRLNHVTYQHRARQIFILARLDFGAPHRNPDGEEIGVPHLHLYREGYLDKWAFAVPIKHFPNIEDRWKTLHDFMEFCSIVDPPIFKRDLFL